ncbi:hypothetical protein EUX98_g2148 [Antrodiella citrinella]|uniref:Uncharacterized protein n=1 Tax=Antrodiella citrinella TaxID=2447956 RepID=A0A4S4MZP3_9APHY|nr:hypothetical protein EUX98_g2148 [Antrodiella citrinella]
MNELADSPSRPGVSVSPRFSSTPPSREPERQRDPPILKPRAVLRRKVSARSGVSTPSAATIKTSSVQSSAQTNSFSSNETSRGSASRQPARSSETARPGAPSASTSRRVGGSGTADPISVRAGLKDASPPSGLTPAGAVAHAYKQQEERREKLAEMSGGNDHLDTLHSMHSQTSVSTLSFAKMPDSDDDLSLTAVDVKTDGPIEPYYTVFGSSSDRLFASREEEWQLSFDAYYGCGTSRTTTVTAAAAIAPVAKPDSGHGSGTAGGMKGLSRKMSGRLRKVTGTGRSGRDDSPQRGSRPERKEKDAAEGQGKVWMPYDGRESGTQDGGGISLDVGRASSVDGFVKVDVRETMSSIASNVQGDKFDASKRSHKPPIHDKDKSKQKEREKEKEEEPSSGGKLWKLMKRISTGGLRDKYSGTRNSLPPPPPVPALPKDFLPSRLTLDIQKPASDELVGESGILLSRFMQSRSSMSGLRPSTASSSQPTARAETDPRSRPSTGNKADPRPSTTTRSSSPMSSDIASTKFFQKTHSNRSSTTSYGEELPPLPGSHGVSLSQHIIEPSELYRMDDDDPAHPLTPMNMNRRKPVRSRSAPDDSSSLTSPVEVQPSLPFPPRRAQQSIGGKPPLPPPSPTIPAFNTSVAVNHFPSPPVLSLSMSEFGFADSPLSAPPRPRKSSRRGPNSSDSSPSPSSTNRPSPSSTTKPSPISFSSPRTPVLPSLSIDVFSRSRRSISTTARSKDAPSASPSSSLASPQSKSPLNFRDKESPRTALSEREKAAKWDDLLERSARAGGTLHLGETGLMSDKLRFSVVSEG